jgi:prepilin-type N-terminal cleavage/methylation domain-containing protein
MHRNGKAAFTVIELLVVIAVIAVIAALLFPVFTSTRDKARQAVCLSNLKQIGQALHLYIQDYDERLPICCSWARAGSLDLLTSTCKQEGITNATLTDTYLGPEQNPPRYVHELLHRGHSETGRGLHPRRGPVQLSRQGAVHAHGCATGARAGSDRAVYGYACEVQQIQWSGDAEQWLPWQLHGKLGYGIRSGGLL